MEIIPLSYKYVNTTVDDVIVSMFKETVSDMGLNLRLGLQAAIQEWSIRRK